MRFCIVRGDAYFKLVLHQGGWEVRFYIVRGDAYFKLVLHQGGWGGEVLYS